ncbi:acyltransferase [Metabacillus sp. FJAT-52054]|uniref:Acyltransferase n=1 Tax=Metabacillus sediminis TaxID=3117746 RepID=A0ABZ2NFX1_9BACI
MGANIKRNTFEERQCIDSMKAFSIISVIFAHTSSSPEGAVPFFSLLSANIGTVGVVVFFIISGYLFGKKQPPFFLFLKKKKVVFIPWIFCGSLIYLVTQYGGTISEPLTLTKLFLYLIGYDTYLYYLSMLIVSYLVLFKLKEYNIFLYLFILMTVISVFLTSLNKLWMIQPYINPFNWLGFFSLGILLFKKANITKIYIICRKYSMLIILLFVGFLCLSIYLKEGSYWSSFSLFIELSGAMIIVIIAGRTFSNTLVRYIGKQSFAIYLLHMPVAGITNIIINNTLGIGIVPLIKPIIVLFIVVISINTFGNFSRNTWIGNKLSFVLGMR